jgi:membrane fusion protein (multidrug efflux system)
MANYQMPAATVTAQPAASETWTPYVSSVGTLTANNWVEVTPEINGQVVGIYFSSGQMVHQGDLLVQLDDSTLQAQLSTQKAKVRLDQITYERDDALLKQGATTPEQVDEDIAALQSDEGQAAYYAAQIAYTHVRAPFDGKIGIRQINLGQYLTTGTSIATLASLDPMYVDFPVTQEQISQIALGQQVHMTVGTYPGVTFTGKVIALDSQVTSSNLGLTVRAAVPNNDPAHMLLNGMLADVDLMLPTQENVITVPQVAVNQTLFGSTIYVVETQKGADGKDVSTVHLKNITLGDSQKDEVAITSGIQAGDVVVTTGQLKLHDGAVVTIVPWNKVPVLEAGSTS